MGGAGGPRVNNGVANAVVRFARDSVVGRVGGGTGDGRDLKHRRPVMAQSKHRKPFIAHPETLPLCTSSSTHQNTSVMHCDRPCVRRHSHVKDERWLLKSFHRPWQVPNLCFL